MSESSGGAEKTGLVNFIMDRPWKPMIWSIIFGGILTMVLGFNFLGNWHMGTTVTKLLDEQEEQYAGSYGVALCVAQFLDSEQPAADLKVIEGYSQWRRGPELVDAVGTGQFSWVLMPGEEKANSRIADGCARAVIKLKEQVAQAVPNTG